MTAPVITAPRPTITPAQIRHISIDRLGEMGVILSPEFRAALEPHPREKIITGGWQSGKSYLGACELFLPVFEAMTTELLGLDQPHPRLYWLIVPNYHIAKMEMDYLAGWAKTMGFLSRYHQPDNDSASIDLYGGMFKYVTKTAQDIPAIAGEPCDGVLLVEPGQMPEGARIQAQGRVMAKRGWIVAAGTIEESESKPTFTWYEKTAAEWQKSPVLGERESYRLPTWANLAKFPGGRQDEEIIHAEQSDISARDPNYFKRRYEGLPVGFSNPIYKQLLGGETTSDGHVPAEDYWSLRYYEQHHNELVYLPGKGAGGHDYGSGGENHPSTLVPASMSTNLPPIIVVRDSWCSPTISQREIEYRRLMMSQRYGIPKTRWGFDPLQHEAAEMAGATAVSGGPGSRMARVGRVMAHLDSHTLLWDMHPHDGTPEEKERAQRVRLCFEQMQRVHLIARQVVGQGEVLDYARIDDDMAAAVENLVEVMDGPQRFSFPHAKVGGMKVKPLPKPTYTRRSF